MEILPIYSDTEPGDEIVKVFGDQATVDISCEMCGRYHYSDDWDCDNESIDPEEQEKEWALNPDKNVHHSGCNTIHYGHHQGKQVVIGCPCNYLTTIEEQWWEDRKKFLRFIEEKYRNRGLQIRKEEDQLHLTLEEVKS